MACWLGLLFPELRRASVGSPIGGASWFPEPLICSSVCQDKLLEEMWKQQDSLEAPAATETPGSPEADAGSENGNALLERLRALEVKWITESADHYFCFFPIKHPL